jgi:hypothetical protein
MNKVELYRRRPLVFQAYKASKGVELDTPNGKILVKKGDWVCTGENKAVYICSDQEFNATYVNVDESDGLREWEKKQWVERLAQIFAANFGAKNWRDSYLSVVFKQFREFIQDLLDSREPAK